MGSTMLPWVCRNTVFDPQKAVLLQHKIAELLRGGEVRHCGGVSWHFLCIAHLQTPLVEH
jgi:hypothetical protein